MTALHKTVSTLFMAFVLLALVGCSVASGQKTAGEFVDDSVITTRIKAAFIEDPELKVTEIQVETFKGVVQLSGFVRSSAMAQRAVEVARGVSGVKSVKNDMRLR
ncbi:MAG: BON domain-containing protein [Halopseudomonas sp.]